MGMGRKFSFKFNKKYFADGLLIVFSVLFALFINKTAENIKTRQDKNEAREEIRMEIEGNLKVLEEWMVRHSETFERLSKITEGKDDSLKNQLLEYNFLNTYILAGGKSFLHDIIVQNAWDTAKATGIISEFDFDITQRLTKVYNLQEMIMGRTIANLTDRLTATETHNMENIDLNLLGLQFLMMELLGQERLLKDLYQDMLQKL